MAARKQPHALSLLFFLALSTLPCIISSSDATKCVGPGDISVYWGRDPEADEGSLREACDSRESNYGIVLLSFLHVYNANASTTPPKLKLRDHCNPNSCSILAPEIEHCQRLGIKVFLSLRMELLTPPPPKAAVDTDFTADLKNYLVENFLSGNPDGPLGAVYLDGINIENSPAGTLHVHWDELAGLLVDWSSSTGRKVYISASPPCPYDQDPLYDLIHTGLVDYVWVEFYGNHPSCAYYKYIGRTDKLLEAWRIWTSNVTKSSIFLGLIATDDYTEGYIDPAVVRSEILPEVKKASNYGGVMIFNRYFDKINHYAPKIRDSVPKICKCDCNGNETAFTRFNSLLARS